MRIVTGSLRGRIIPFHKRQGTIRLTSSRLKEAVFAMLGADLSGLSFLDLCAGSGQMGLEACSRGARALLNEPDRRRHAHIRELLRRWQVRGAELCNAKAQMLIPQLAEESRLFDIAYLDPPYHATRAGIPLSLSLLEQLGTCPLLAADGLLLIQHQSALPLPAEAGSLRRLRDRRYGDTTLSIYTPS